MFIVRFFLQDSEENKYCLFKFYHELIRLKYMNEVSFFKKIYNFLGYHTTKEVLT